MSAESELLIESANLAKEVSVLAVNYKTLKALCGEMLATLQANRMRDTIISADDRQFDEMIEAWRNRFLAS